VFFERTIVAEPFGAFSLICAAFKLNINLPQLGVVLAFVVIQILPA